MFPEVRVRSDSADEALEFARTVGFPCVDQGVCRRGGKGMRVAVDEKNLRVNFTAAKTEAAAAFGTTPSISRST